MTSEPLLYRFRSKNQPIQEKGSYQQGFSCFSESNLTPLGKSCGIPQRLHNIFFLYVGIIREKLLIADPLANLTYNHANSYPHTANAGLATHNSGVLGYPVKFLIEHKTNITQKQAKNKFNDRQYQTRRERLPYHSSFWNKSNSAWALLSFSSKVDMNSKTLSLLQTILAFLQVSRKIAISSLLLSLVIT